MSNVVLTRFLQMIDGASAILSLPNETTLPLESDHMSMCKYLTITSVDYLTVSNCIAELVDTVPRDLEENSKYTRHAFLKWAASVRLLVHVSYPTCSSRFGRKGIPCQTLCRRCEGGSRSHPASSRHVLNVAIGRPRLSILDWSSRTAGRMASRASWVRQNHSHAECR